MVSVISFDFHPDHNVLKKSLVGDIWLSLTSATDWPAISKGTYVLGQLEWAEAGVGQELIAGWEPQDVKKAD